MSLRRVRSLAALILAGGLLVGCGGAPVPATASDALRATAACTLAMHPSLPEARRAAVQAVADAEAARLDTDPTAVGGALHRLVGAFFDAHVRVGSSVRAGRLLPLWLREIEGRFYVDASTAGWPAGTEVLEIEGRPVEAWVQDMLPLTSVDGAASAEVRRAQAVRRFASLLWPLVGEPERFEIAVRLHGTRTATTVAAVDGDRLEALAAERYTASTWGAPGRWPALSRLADGSAHLRLATFGVPAQEEYIRRVHAAFDALSGDERLVLDLRGNEGGYRTLGVAVLQHLLAAPFTQWSRFETRLEALPEICGEGARFVMGVSEDALTRVPGDRVGAGRRFDGDPLADRMVPLGAPHAGEVVVFVDDATNSAAIELVAALLAHRDGVRVLGTETQGGCDRHTGEVPVLYPVPGTTWGVLMSLAEITLVPVPGCRPGRGIEPGERVEVTLEDLMTGRDAYLARLGR